MAAKKLLRQSTDALVRADAKVDRKLSPHRKGTLVEAVARASDIGDQPQLRLLCGTTFAAGLLTGNRRLVQAGIRMLLAHELATMVKSFVKDNVDRTRPRSARSQRQRKPTRGSNRSKEESSFPSGHTAGAVAVARAFAREFPEYRGAAATAAAVVAAAQVPRCAHYVSDVGAGAAVGFVAEAAANGFWQSMGPSSMTETDQLSTPSFP